MEAYATALRGEPGADSKRRPASVRVDEQMLHYATTWLPLVSFALIAGCLGVNHQRWGGVLATQAAKPPCRRTPNTFWRIPSATPITMALTPIPFKQKQANRPLLLPKNGDPLFWERNF